MQKHQQMTCYEQGKLCKKGRLFHLPNLRRFQLRKAFVMWYYQTHSNQQ
jgi:hypothetical protein